MISIHQSQFLSWVPFYYKVLKSDNFIIMDDVQFQKNGVQNRNMIKTPQGASWLTLPVKHHLGITINDVNINNIAVYEKIIKTLEINYKKSTFFPEVFSFLEAIFGKSIENLNDLNNQLFLEILKKLDIQPSVSYSSEYQLSSKKDDLVIDLILRSGDNEYLSGAGAFNYMDLEKFKKNNIKVYTYKFEQVTYTQLWNQRVGFIKDLSIVDLLFNELNDAKKYITDNGIITRII
jgi:hypothetical protein